MSSANDLRKGQVIKFNNEPYLVMETQHRTPGNLRAFVQAKLRNLKNGRSFDQRFNSTETMDVLSTDRRTLEFSYANRDNFAFLDPDNYDTVELSAAMIGDAKNYLVANGKVEVLFVDDHPVTVDLPSSGAPWSNWTIKRPCHDTSEVAWPYAFLGTPRFFAQTGPPASVNATRSPLPNQANTRRPSVAIVGAA